MIKSQNSAGRRLSPPDARPGPPGGGQPHLSPGDRAGGSRGAPPHPGEYLSLIG